MPKPERNLANSLLWNGGPLSDTISSGYPSIEKRSIRRSLNDQNDVFGSVKKGKISRNNHRSRHMSCPSKVK